MLRLPFPVFDAPGAAAGAAAPAAPAAAATTIPAAAAAAAPVAAADPPGHFSKPYYPEGLADGFRGKNDQETIDRLAKAARSAPAAADAYKLDMAPEVQKLMKGDLAKDPAYLAFRDAAHRHGLDQNQFNGLFNDIIGGFQKAGVFAPPIDTKAELAKLAGNEVDPVKGAAAAESRITAASNFISAQVERGVISRDEARAFIALTAVADGVSLVEKIAARFGAGQGVTAGGVAAGAGPTREQLIADMGDPRYDSMSPKFDKNFRARVDAAWQNLPRQ